MSKYYFFYSDHCTHCNDFKIALTNAGLINDFKQICVDNKNIRLPRKLSQVPAIVIPAAAAAGHCCD